MELTAASSEFSIAMAEFLVMPPGNSDFGNSQARFSGSVSQATQFVRNWDTLPNLIPRSSRPPYLVSQAVYVGNVHCFLTSTISWNQCFVTEVAHFVTHFVSNLGDLAAT